MAEEKNIDGESADEEIVVVGSDYCTSEPAEFTLSKSRFLTCNGEYTLKDAEKNIVLDVDGNWGCCRERRLMDPKGRVLLRLQKQQPIFRTKWKAYRGDGDTDDSLLFTVKKPCFQLKFRLSVYLAGSSEPDYIVKGCFFTGKYSISKSISKEIIAKAKRKWGIGCLFRCHTYDVVVEKGVDWAFVVALFITMNEIMLDKPPGHGD